MTEASSLKRSPTTPSTPRLAGDYNSKKFKGEFSSSPTKSGKNKTPSVKELMKENICQARELKKVKELLSFLELERKASMENYGT
ncbi:LAMI_0G16600g1_1 [Lachancea mirantina]|uniref:LAMI_0G16600g1_1 n=1 Tax=Lachancea mirantina TaxID=1230905 RepID=A0A1G4KCU1_9SACH|nr:LAMI_0G16600g1_1 [Lachancea mirantina]